MTNYKHFKFKTIVGEILALILVISCFLCFTIETKAAAIDDILGIDEIPVGSTLTFNETLDFSMLDEFASYMVTGLYSQNIYFNALNEKITFQVWGGERDLYNESWNDDYTNGTFITSSILILQVNGSTNNSDEDFLDFLKANATLTTPVVNITLTFKNNTGSATYGTRTITSGTTELMDFNPHMYEFPNDSYNFLGWSTSPNSSVATIPYSSEYTFTEDTILYEVWEEKEVDPPIVTEKYYVTFNLNGGSGTVPSPYEFTSEFYYVLNNNVVTPSDLPKYVLTSGNNIYREHYVFKGWSKVSNATRPLLPDVDGEDYYLEEDVMNHVLFAVWEELPSFDQIGYYSFNNQYGYQMLYFFDGLDNFNVSFKYFSNGYYFTNMVYNYDVTNNIHYLYYGNQLVYKNRWLNDKYQTIDIIDNYFIGINDSVEDFQRFFAINFDYGVINFVDLNGYFKFDNDLNINSQYSFRINLYFISNNQYFNYITYSNNILYYDDLKVYENGQWLDNKYQLILISNQTVNNVTYNFLVNNGILNYPYSIEYGENSIFDLFLAVADVPTRTISNLLSVEIFGTGVTIFTALCGLLTIVAVFFIFKKLKG